MRKNTKNFKAREPDPLPLPGLPDFLLVKHIKTDQISTSFTKMAIKYKYQMAVKYIKWP
jgi:hypothetical protein